MRTVDNNSDNSQWDTVSNALSLATGIFRANTAELLEKKAKRDKAEAEAMRQAQAAIIPGIADPKVREAFRLQQGIEQREISAIGTQVQLARFNRNSQYLEATKGGLGLLGDFGDSGGGGGGLSSMDPTTLALGSAAVAYFAGRQANRDDDDDEPLKTVPVLTTTGT